MKLLDLSILTLLMSLLPMASFAQECKELLFDKDGKYYFNDGTIVTAPDKKTAIERFNKYKNSIELFNKGDQLFIKQNYKEAVEYFKKAYELGSTRAAVNLGYCYKCGLGVEPDNYKAFEYYMRAASSGEKVAQYSVANLFVEYKNYEAAAEFFEKAANQGHVLAQRSIGDCYYKGQGVRRNYTKAAEWYEKAASQGDAGAQNSLAYCYFEGTGVAQSYLDAVKWYAKAANQGDTDAQFYLGYMYSEGLGVSQDYAESVKWYQKAAEKAAKAEEKTREKAKAKAAEASKEKTQA